MIFETVLICLNSIFLFAFIRFCNKKLFAMSVEAKKKNEQIYEWYQKEYQKIINQSEVEQENLHKFAEEIDREIERGME